MRKKYLEDVKKIFEEHNIKESLIEFFKKVNTELEEYLKNIEQIKTITNDAKYSVYNHNKIAQYINENFDNILNNINEKIFNWFKNSTEEKVNEYQASLTIFSTIIHSKNSEIENKYTIDIDLHEEDLFKRKIEKRKWGKKGKPDYQKYFIDLFIKTLIWKENKPNETGSYDDDDELKDFINDKIITLVKDKQLIDVLQR